MRFPLVYKVWSIQLGILFLVELGVVYLEVGMSSYCFVWQEQRGLRPKVELLCKLLIICNLVSL